MEKLSTQTNLTTKKCNNVRIQCRDSWISRGIGPLVGWRSWEICEKLENDSLPFRSVSVTAPKLRVVSQTVCFISLSVYNRFPLPWVHMFGLQAPVCVTVSAFNREQLKLLFQFQILRGKDLIESDSFKDQTPSNQEGTRVL